MAQNIAEESPICKFNQTGYCRYGETCPKTHNNTLCSEKVCRRVDCRERHPKTCRYFSENKFCRLKDLCAYAHHISKEETNLANIEREIKLLNKGKEKLSEYRAVIDVKLQKMISNEIELQRLKNVVENQRKQIEDLIDRVKKLEQNNFNQQSEAKDNSSECDICGYKGTTGLMLTKHKNTKHVIEKKSECSMCEEKFDNYDDYTDHVSEHLEEIKGINIDYLKSGHETFECSLCKFESNDTDLIKNHLANHVLQTKKTPEKLTREEQEALLKTKDWRDMYDEYGNPLYETTDEESSDNDE